MEKDNKISSAPERKELSAPSSNEAGKKEEAGGASTAIKAFAVLGIIALLLLGLYGTSRVVAGLPEAARSIASGFVSVTSQFFGADDNGDDEDENEDGDEVVVEDDVDEEEEVDEEENTEEEGDTETEEDPTDTTPTNTGGGETVTRTQSEYRIVQRPVIRPIVSDPNGDVDLELTILATGYLDRSEDNEFVETDEVDPEDTVAVKFQVKNIGTKTSEEWRYRAELPTNPDFTYDSEEQFDLKPGERMEFILAFTDIEDDGGEAEIEIEIDPSRDLDESERDNNRETVDVRVDD